MEAALRDEFMKLPGAVIAFCQGFVGKILDRFFDLTTFCAFIFIDGHFLKTSAIF
jgi:hypothetical protein